MDIMSIDQKYLEWVAIGIVIVGFIIWRIFQNWRKGKDKSIFSIKKSINAVGHYVNLILMMYVFIGGAQILATVKTWSLEQSANSLGLAEFMWKSFPFAVIVFIVYFAIKIARIEWVKYSDKEKEWLKAEEQSEKDKRPAFLKKLLGDDDNKKDDKK